MKNSKDDDHTGACVRACTLAKNTFTFRAGWTLGKREPAGGVRALGGGGGGWVETVKG